PAVAGHVAEEFATATRILDDRSDATAYLVGKPDLNQVPGSYEIDAHLFSFSATAPNSGAPIPTFPSGRPELIALCSASICSRSALYAAAAASCLSQRAT